MTILCQDNFDGDTVGALPAGWVATNGAWSVGTANPVSAPNSLTSTTQATGNLVLFTGQGSSAPLGLQYDQIITTALAPGANQTIMGAALRMDSLGKNGYEVYVLPANPTVNSIFVRIVKVVSGTVTTLGTASSGPTVNLGDTLHLRATANGTTISVYAWTNANAQPGAPTFTLTDSTFSAAGYAGFYYTSGVIGVDNVVIDNVAASTISAATALTLSGPSSGFTGASATFTVSTNGTLSAGVTVTPNDGGAGGTFSPTTVTLGPTGIPVSFVYTPSINGTISLSLTNNSSLTNPSSLTYTVAPPPAATALTMTGPTTSASAATSAPFTVTANGQITGTLTVTPNDGGAGGTFSPATLSMSGYQPSATFVYIAAAAGTPSVGVTNNQSLTNPAAIAVTVANGISSRAAAVFQSPYNWDSLNVGDYGVAVPCVQTPSCGAYLKVNFSGSTTFSVYLDTSIYGAVPSGSLTITARLDKGSLEVVLPVQQSTALHTFFTGLATGSHTVEVYLSGSTQNIGTRWGANSTTSPTSVIRVMAFVLDTGGVLAAPTLRPKRALFFGDSITEGVNASGTTTQPADHGKSYPWFIAPALNAERGTVGFASSGWTHVGVGGVPVFPTFWNLYSTGRSRNLTPAPDYVFVMQSQNDAGSSAVTALAVTWLSQARAAFPSAWIFILPPPSATGATQLQAAVSQYRTATPADQKVVYLNIFQYFDNGGFGILGSATAQSVDHVHPLERENGRISDAIFSLIAPYSNKTRYFGVGGTWY
jgi:lysophospholipase L1-like esterase